MHSIVIFLCVTQMLLYWACNVQCRVHYPVNKKELGYFLGFQYMNVVDIYVDLTFAWKS